MAYEVACSPQLHLMWPDEGRLERWCGLEALQQSQLANFWGLAAREACFCAWCMAYAQHAHMLLTVCKGHFDAVMIGSLSVPMYSNKSMRHSRMRQVSFTGRT